MLGLHDAMDLIMSFVFLGSRSVFVDFLVYSQHTHIVHFDDQPNLLSCHIVNLPFVPWRRQQSSSTWLHTTDAILVSHTLNHLACREVSGLSF